MSEPLVVEARNLSRNFGETSALSGLDLTIRKGEMVALVGPDGAGKTTTIRILCGILLPSAGTATVLGYDVITEPEKVKSRIGYLSQRFSLYGDLSIDENIEFFAEINRVTNYHERREELLAFTRLSPFRSRLAEKLSGGMKQKLALACTLIHTPDLLLLDEPTTGVDPVSRRDFWAILHHLVGQGLTIIMTTPYLDEAERSSRIALLNRGKVLEEGSPEALRGRLEQQVAEIVCDPVRAAYELLTASGEFHGVQAFGDRLNVLIGSHTEIDRAVHLIKEAGIRVSGTRIISPTLENVFISLLNQHDQKEVHS